MSTTNNAFDTALNTTQALKDQLDQAWEKIKEILDPLELGDTQASVLVVINNGEEINGIAKGYRLAMISGLVSVAEGSKFLDKDIQFAAKLIRIINESYEEDNASDEGQNTETAKD